MREIPCRVIAKVLDCDLEVNEFELHPRYYVHFQTNEFVEKVRTLLFAQQSV